MGCLSWFLAFQWPSLIIRFLGVLLLLGSCGRSSGFLPDLPLVRSFVFSGLTDGGRETVEGDSDMGKDLTLRASGARASAALWACHCRMRSCTEGDSERVDATFWVLSDGILSGRRFLEDLRGGFEEGSGRICRLMVAGTVESLVEVVTRLFGSCFGVCGAESTAAGAC